MRWWIQQTAGAALLALAGLARAQTSAPALTEHAALSPAEVQAVVQMLSADDYATRQEALHQLELGIAENLRRTIVVQEAMLRLQAALGQQLKVMTMTHDLEAVARTAALMEFNEALARWAVATMALPETERAAAVQWGLSEKGLPVVARAYSPRASVRTEGIREMAGMPGLAVSLLLAGMVGEQDREVTLAAMDALWDRPPTALALAVLWDKSVTSVMAAYGGEPGGMRNRVVHFHGRQIDLGNGNNNINWEDSALATDLLVHLHDPEVAQRLRTFLQELVRQSGDPNLQYRYQVLLPNYGGPGQNFQRLIDAYKPREIVAVYMHFLTGANINDGTSNSGAVR